MGIGDLLNGGRKPGEIIDLCCGAVAEILKTAPLTIEVRAPGRKPRRYEYSPDTAKSITEQVQVYKV